MGMGLHSAALRAAVELRYKKIAPLSYPIRGNIKTNCDSSFDWFTRLSVSSMTAQSDYLGIGFTTLN